MASMNWTISYTDFFGKKKVEAFTDKDEAQARYESLLPRTYGDFGDLMSVTAPIRSATKISESVLDDVDLSNQWDDLNAVVKGLFIRGFDNPSGKYFYVKSDYRNDEDACHSVYSKGTDSHQLDIHILGGEEPFVAVVNQGLQDESFDMAYDAIELIVKDWFNMVADGFHGVIAKIDDPSEYAVWKKSKGFKNEDGASASSLGVAPTGVVRRKTESKKNEGWTFGWFDKQTMVDDCVADYERSGNTLDKRYGDWACFYHNQDGRPFVVYFKTAKDGGQWGVKEIESCMGPYETNIQAARWLKPRLEEWTSKDPKNAEKIQDYEWEWIEKCLGKEASNKAKKDVVKSLVEGDRIKLIDTVADGAVVEFVRMLTPSKMLIKHNGREMGCKTSFIDHKIEKPAESVFDDDGRATRKPRAKRSEAKNPYYGYGKDDAIDKDDNDFMWQVAYDWLEERLPEKFKQSADRAVTEVIDRDMRAYEEIVTMDDYYDYLETYGPAVIEEITGDFAESKKNESGGADLASVYGSGDIVTHENSADGFYVDDHDPMGWAILNNDVATMKELFAGNATTPDKPWLYAGWVEDTDAPEDKEGNYPYVYNWESERDLNFVNDWKRVVGETDNEEALNLLLEHDPDFIPTAIDFYNAFLAGYDKKLLRKLLDNISAVWDRDDINDSYLNYEDFGETPYENLIEFLGE